MAPSDGCDGLERVTAATVRAVGQTAATDVAFSNQTSQIRNGQVRLQSLCLPCTAADLMVFRGIADAAACWLRYHEDDIHEHFAPAGGAARQAFERLEQVRCESLGAADFSGIATNLQSMLQIQHALRIADDEPWSDALPILLKIALNQQPLSEADVQLIDQHRLQRLANVRHDQAAYAQEVIDLLAELELDAEPDAETEPMQRLATDQPEEHNESVEQQDCVKHAAAEPWRPDPSHGALQYRVFSYDFDEIIPAEALCSVSELARLRAVLDKQLLPLQGLVTRLANQLQRRLLAQQNRAWAFDLDEGLLDSRRLPQVIIDPLSPLVFKQEQAGVFRNTVVSLLIDNSRSMRGWPIQIAAMSADILARTLERCGVKVEILGFTTCSWKTGRSGERWLAQGQPSEPGRLNDLRHIIYKAADVPWRRIRSNLGLMMRVDVLKQNIDGEALLWAHQRLLARPEQRRILLVISDGAPVDEFTLSVNDSGLLDQHLREVITCIEAYSDIELAAIGIGYDVTRYYRRAAVIKTAAQFSQVLMDQLHRLFIAD